MNLKAGIALNVAIGQRVKFKDSLGAHTGVVHGLSLSSDRVIDAEIVLDVPIVLPPRGDGDRELTIRRQFVSAHELTPFDVRDELLDELSGALQALLDAHAGGQPVDQRLLEAGHLAMAKVKACA